MPVSELADWWDGEKAESEEILEEWVQDNPQWWAIGIATAGATAMELGGGMVDALRFGEGIAEGGVKGVGKDVLRLLVVVGPIAKGMGILGRVAHTQSIRLAVTTRGVTGPCTFTAVNNALSIVKGGSRSLFLTARDAANALGRPLAGIATHMGKYKLAAWIDDLVPFLTRQGVKLRNLGIPRSIAEVKSAAQSGDGVVIFAIKWTDQAGKVHKHSMIAVRTLRGVRFADYGGKFISDLSQLANRGGIWRATSGFSVYSSGAKGSAVLVEGMKLVGALGRHARTVFNGGMLLLEGVHAIETPQGVDLAFPVVPAATTDDQADDPQLIKASYRAFKARKKGRTVVKLPPISLRGRRPPRPSFLTGVQYRLNAAGFGAGPVDGIYGPKTKRAVRRFQRSYPPLRVDAIPGPNTQAKLVEVCGF